MVGAGAGLAMEGRMRRLAVVLLLGGCLGDAAMNGGSGDGGALDGAGRDQRGGDPSADLAGSPLSTGGPDAGEGGAGPTTEVAPYFYTWGWGSTSYAFKSLVDLKSQGGPDAVTLAFVLSNGGCAVTTD